jgi:hypothetical protein
MKQPERCLCGFEHKVCKLNCSLYGSKQATRVWYYKFQTYLFSLSFICITANSNVYVKFAFENFINLALYVDDAILISNHLSLISKIKSNSFKILKLQIMDPSIIYWIFTLIEIDWNIPLPYIKINIFNKIDQLYYILRKNITFLFLVLYVDDSFLFSNDLELTSKIKTMLSSKYEMTNLRDLYSSFHLQVIRDRITKCYL